MKLKCLPEDFRVEEIAEFPHGGGPFAIYRLTKTSLGTPEAIEAICRAWHVAYPDVGFGGLKDRHALTSQFVSILDGPQRDLAQTNIQLEFISQASRAFDFEDIRGNRFEIVVRDLQSGDSERIIGALGMVLEYGVPNYFDEQRFGSVGASGDFVARPWCLGDYERALWLAIAEPNVHDRPRVREEKTRLQSSWGNWPACRAKLERPMTRAAIERLCRNPRDFRGAFIQIPQHERRMYLGAFQSMLWNRVLADTIRESVDSADQFDVEIAGSRVPFYRSLSSEAVETLSHKMLPLPSSRERAELGPLSELYERVAGEFGLACRELRVKYPRDSFFSRGSRPAIFRPLSLGWDVGIDELSQGDSRESAGKLTLRFDLLPGCYATIVIKQISDDPAFRLDG